MSEKDELSEEKHDDLFYFESDHLALQGNVDYSDILKTIIVLEAQRVQAIKNYETVLQLQKDALDDPMTIVDKLQKGEQLGIPDFQKVAEIPRIKLHKYKVPVPKKCMQLLDKTFEETFSGKGEKDEEYRGTTHKQPWSSEEQKRLEELLIVYPPEAIEMNRFKKIAAALGNRTVKQVTSRVQKYFLKLHRFGLPIPGRIPKWKFHANAKKLAKNMKCGKFYEKPTTFFPHQIIPVSMPEDVDVPGPSSMANFHFSANASEQKCIEHNEDELSEEKKKEFKLQLLEKVKRVKERESSLEAHRHLGFMCDFCKEEPIFGSRWHCTTCQDESFDFCTDCIISQLYSESNQHFSHAFAVIGADNVILSPPEIGYVDDFHFQDSDSSEEENYAPEENAREEEEEEMGEKEDDDEEAAKSNIYDEDYFLASVEDNYLDPNYQVK